MSDYCANFRAYVASDIGPHAAADCRAYSGPDTVCNADCGTRSITSASYSRTYTGSDYRAYGNSLLPVRWRSS